MESKKLAMKGNEEGTSEERERTMNILGAIEKKESNRRNSQVIGLTLLVIGFSFLFLFSLGNIKRR